MKNRILTNTRRNIVRSMPRFLSLVIMSMLGVFVFAGLQATPVDMLYSLDQYYDNHSIYDLKVVSTLGIDDEDLDAVKKIKGIKEVVGSYNEDVIFSNKHNDYVLSVNSMIDSINTIDCIKGRLPKNNHEIVIEEHMFNRLNYHLNDKVVLKSKHLKKKQYTIVGVVDSALYFNASMSTSANRGSTNVATGNIDYYAYVLDSSFNQDYYSYMYMRVDNASSQLTSSTSYLNSVNQVKNRLEKIQETREKERYDTIYEEALSKIYKEKDKAYLKLNENKSKLDNSNKQLKNVRIQLEDAKKQLDTSKAQLDQAKKQIDQGILQYQKTLGDYRIDERQIETQLVSLSQSIKQLKPLLSSNQVEIVNQYKALNEQYTLLSTLKENKSALDASKKSYIQNEATYQKQYEKYLKIEHTYTTNLQKYKDGLKAYNDRKKEVDKKIEDAKEGLKDIKACKWSILDRTGYQTYSDYIDDCQSIKNLSKIFPVVFYAVAVLVSLISMNRMVEDDRGEIGTLKSLGFSNQMILVKYLVFSLIATIIGGMIGGALGIIIIPKLINSIYTILFELPTFVIKLNMATTFLGLLISILCVCGTTIYTILKVLKEKSAELLRPKSPKAGKRILLEKVDLIWSRLSFSNKVTIRNIFRYKKRVFVTLVGIVGCSALVLIGFGIKDSIVDIPASQYGRVFDYDASSYISIKDVKEIDEVFKRRGITSYTSLKNINTTYKNSNIHLFVSRDVFNHTMHLYDLKTKKEIKLDKNKVVVSDKLAQLKGIKEGDKIKIVDDENNIYQLSVQAIIENYIDHLVLMDASLYKGEYQPNVVYFNIDESTSKEKLKKELLEKDAVINVTYVSKLIENVENMLKSLDKVVLILVILASLLSFVVLYNLANININERKREVATIKVLGFYDKEVDSYINKEMLIITLLGIIVGLLLGTVLSSVVVSTVEIEKCRFICQIKSMSYIYSIMITMTFTLIVSSITHFILKKINMVESLKSVE